MRLKNQRKKGQKVGYTHNWKKVKEYEMTISYIQRTYRSMEKCLHDNRKSSQHTDVQIITRVRT